MKKSYRGKNDGPLMFHLSENVALPLLPKEENQPHGSTAETKMKKKYVGVRQRPSGRWVAEIKDTTQKIRLWLGTFNTAEDAARAYDEAACLLRGTNTRTNFSHSNADESTLPSKAAKTLLSHRGPSKLNPALSAAHKLLDFSRPKRSTPMLKPTLPDLLQESYTQQEVSISNNLLEPGSMSMQSTGKRSRDLYEDTQMSAFDIYSGFQEFEDIPRNQAEPVHMMNGVHDCLMLAERAMSSPSLSLPPDFRASAWKQEEFVDSAESQESLWDLTQLCTVN